MPVTAGVVAIPLIAGAIGDSKADKDRTVAQANRNMAVAQFLSINIPDPAQQKVAFERYQQTGRLAPELEQAFNQSQTELNGVAVDPSTRAAQMSALQKMTSISDANGMDAQARASNQQAINSAEQMSKGQRGAVAQNFAMRGQGGSGAELQAQLLAGQQDANTAANQGMLAAAGAQQRALQAMSSSASLAGQVNATDYAQKADAAKAQDLINQFNTKNSQQVNSANTSIQNGAQGANLAAQQAVSNANVGISNQEQTTNKAVNQQAFENQMQQAAGTTGQLNLSANQANQNAAATSAQWAGIGNAIGQGAAAYGQYSNNKKDKADTTDTSNDENAND